MNNKLNKKLKFAVLGCGAVGREALSNVVKLEHVECVGAFEPDAKTARSVADAFGIKTFADLGEMLDKTKPDCVKICSPNKCHAEQAVLCLEKGCHVLVEKPMGTNMEDCRKMVDAQKKTGRILAVNFEYRISKLFAKINEIIESGKIGEVRNIFIYESRGPFMGEKGGWRFKKGAAGGLIAEKLVHYIDLAHFFSKSDIVRAFAFHGPNTISHYEFPDNAFLILKHANGAQSVIGSHHGLQPEWDFGGYLDMGDPVLREKRFKWWEKTGHKDFAVIIGSKGAIHADADRELVVANVYVPCDSRGGQSTRCDAEYDFSYLDRMEQVHDQKGMLMHFFEAARGNEKIKTSALDVLNSMAATFAAEKATESESGTAVNVTAYTE